MLGACYDVAMERFNVLTPPRLKMPTISFNLSWLLISISRTAKDNQSMGKSAVAWSSSLYPLLSISCISIALYFSRQTDLFKNCQSQFFPDLSFTRATWMHLFTLISPLDSPLIRAFSVVAALCRFTLSVWYIFHKTASKLKPPALNYVDSIIHI